MTGMVIKARVIPPTSGEERGRPNSWMKIARPSRPKMIEGTAARLLIETSIHSTHLARGANSSSQIAASTPSGNDRTKVTPMVRSEPLNELQIPAVAASVESDPVRNAKSIPPMPFFSMVNSKKARKASDTVIAAMPSRRKRRSAA